MTTDWLTSRRFRQWLCGFVALALSSTGVTAAGATAQQAESVPAAAACAESIAITRGGRYSGCWTSSEETPAISILTREPVTIVDSTVSGRGDLIRLAPGARVTVEQVTATGGAGRFLAAQNVSALSIRNSTIRRTAGIYVLGAVPEAMISITRNRLRNLQSPDAARSFVQFDKVTTARIDVSWNEVINAYGRSAVDGDLISLYRTAFARIHDNYLQGAYPRDPASPFSGSGIMIEEAGSHDNVVSSNQVVETTNVGIGIAAGYNNTIRDNRLVFDGRLWDGTRLAGANVGFYVWNSSNDPEWGNNDAYRNTVGWMNAWGTRNDWWLPHCSRNCGNTRLRGALDRTRELSEHRLWRAKLAKHGIRIGRTT